MVLNLQTKDYLDGITHGYGARIQIHNYGAYPDPYQDGFSVPASMETSIGLKQVVLSILNHISLHMSRSMRKPTFWTLRKVSTRVSLSIPCRLTRTDTVRLQWIFVSGIITLYLYPPEKAFVGPD